MIVTLVTDYGHDDDFVGVCHGVIRSICPNVEIVDVTHGVPRHDVRRGALVLRNTMRYMPVGVHVAVVDPEVGSRRRALALRCRDGRLLVGPDNGLLSLAWERSGGIELAVDVTRSRYRLQPVSATFHGRDIFAPVAAHLADGCAPEDAGEPVEPGTLADVDLPRNRVEGDTLVAHVLTLDRFGNAGLNAGRGELAGVAIGETVEIEIAGECYLASRAATFADVKPGELIVYEDAYGMLAVAINRGDATSTLALAPDREIRLRPG